jgi:outer membrane protein W
MTPLVLCAVLSLAVPPDPAEFYRPLDAEADPSIAPAAGDSGYGMALGLHLGYFKPKDADGGEVFYGIHLRLSLLKYFAAEASVDVARGDFADDDGKFTMIPVQISGLFFPFPDSALSPYVLAGAGWYYTQIDFSGTLAALKDERDHAFGVHLGAGAELRLGRQLMIHADVRYVFLDEPGLDKSQLKDEEFDYWQVMIGGSLSF